MEKNNEAKKNSEKKDTCCCSKFHDEFAKHAKRIGSILKEAKAKFNKADDKTKKTVIAGVASAAALIAGAVGYHRIKGGKKKK